MKIGDELRKILPWLPASRGCCGGKTLVQKLNEKDFASLDVDILATQIYNEARKHGFRKELSREKCYKIAGVLVKRTVNHSNRRKETTV